MSETVLVGLGANLGDAAGQLREAVDALGRAYGDLRVSSLWRSAPVDCPPGSPDFANAVVRFDAPPTLEPSALLDALLALERQHGRRRAGRRNAPRSLDLDLLVFGNRSCNEAVLMLPHPRALSRRFVLEPAAEVAPTLRWPGDGRTIAQLAAVLREAGAEERVTRVGPIREASTSVLPVPSGPPAK